MVVRKKSSAGFLSDSIEEEPAKVQMIEEPKEELCLPVVIEPLVEKFILPEIVSQSLPEIVQETPAPRIVLPPVKQSLRHRNVPRLSRINK
jgi:hypothetical protein